jgi:ZIP family zinc transporter
VLDAALWALAGGSALLVGAGVGFKLPVSQKVIGLVMGFGAGVLISALAFELAVEAHRKVGGAIVAVGLLAGALAFFAGDHVLDRMGAHGRKSSAGKQAEGTAMAIVLGVLMDGVPESAAIGVTLLEGGTVGLAFVGAVFLSNVPEAIAATTGLRKAGHSVAYVLGLWLGVMAISAISAVLAYAFLGGASDVVMAFILAFAAGAILTMLADTMMPEAFEHAGALVGLVTVLGFAIAFTMSMGREAEPERPGAERPAVSAVATPPP